MGKTLIVRLMALGPLNESNGRRDVYFLLNGETRVVDGKFFCHVERRWFFIVYLLVVDESKVSSTQSAASRQKATGTGEIGAPMSGVVLEVRVEEGSAVEIGDPVAIMSAMSKCFCCFFFKKRP
jgi:pyruvate carboxylase